MVYHFIMRWIKVILAFSLSMFGWEIDGDFTHIATDGRGGVYVAGYTEMVHITRDGSEDRRESIESIDPISDLFRNGLEVVILRGGSGVLEHYTKNLLPAGSDTIDGLFGLYPEAVATPSTGIFFIDRQEGRLYSLMDGEFTPLISFDGIVTARDRGYVIVKGSKGWQAIDITGGSNPVELPVDDTGNVFIAADGYYSLSDSLLTLLTTGEILHKGNILDVAYDLNTLYVLTPNSIERYELWQDSE